MRERICAKHTHNAYTLVYRFYMRTHTEHIHITHKLQIRTGIAHMHYTYKIAFIAYYTTKRVVVSNLYSRVGFISCTATVYEYDVYTYTQTTRMRITDVS